MLCSTCMYIYSTYYYCCISYFFCCIVSAVHVSGSVSGSVSATANTVIIEEGNDVTLSCIFTGYTYQSIMKLLGWTAVAWHHLMVLC